MISLIHHVTLARSEIRKSGLVTHPIPSLYRCCLTSAVTQPRCRTLFLIEFYLHRQENTILNDSIIARNTVIGNKLEAMQKAQKELDETAFMTAMSGKHHRLQ